MNKKDLNKKISQSNYNLEQLLEYNYFVSQGLNFVAENPDELKYKESMDWFIAEFQKLHALCTILKDYVDPEEFQTILKKLNSVFIKEKEPEPQLVEMAVEAREDNVIFVKFK